MKLWTRENIAIGIFALTIMIAMHVLDLRQYDAYAFDIDTLQGIALPIIWTVVIMPGSFILIILLLADHISGPARLELLDVSIRRLAKYTIIMPLISLIYAALDVLVIGAINFPSIMVWVGLVPLLWAFMEEIISDARAAKHIMKCMQPPETV